MNVTKQKLLDGALETVRVHGVAGVSARTIAAVAGVNQALVFYHYGSVGDLLAAACVATAETRASLCRDRFASVNSLKELLDAARARHREERVLAQLLAGAQVNEKLAAPTADAVRWWSIPIEAALNRLLADAPSADVRGLSSAIVAAFIGLDLIEGVDPEGGRAALSALERLAVLLDAARSGH